MKFLITGAMGQLGKSLTNSLLEQKQDFKSFSSKELDITDNASLSRLFLDYDFDCILNAAAYTNVDKAEVDNEKAMMVNANSLDLLSSLCKKHNKKLVHFSTDYVFDGKQLGPYKPTSKTNPINYYGHTKLLGEDIILGYDFDSLIIRTSWIFSAHPRNFLTNILNLANENTSIAVVNDQYGCPTHAKDLSDAVIKICMSKKKPSNKIYHLSGSTATTWFKFAESIIALAIEYHLIKHEINIKETSSKSFNAIAKRPNNSVLDSAIILEEFNLDELNWEKALADIICYIKAKGKK